MCKPLEKGGLGIRPLNLVNRALLGKCLWRFGKDKSAFWRKVIVAKYGEDSVGWRSLHPKGPFEYNMWKTISKVWNDFEGFIVFEVHNG